MSFDVADGLHAQAAVKVGNAKEIGEMSVSGKSLSELQFRRGDRPATSCSKSVGTRPDTPLPQSRAVGQKQKCENRSQFKNFTDLRTDLRTQTYGRTD